MGTSRFSVGNLSMQNVSGICIPCNSMLDTANIVHAMIINDDIVKVGKSEGQWYIVQQFNQSKRIQNNASNESR
ncbi:hypothetical protein [Pseudomonas phage vB_PseuGesM_254]|uniref:Uncharacterized protein n=1 Tax=Pseudomonas phage vB_PseuGesM_254 TaxID=3092638 RepID=A0AAX4G7B4_9CAUD|nr:hypothetical protein [Pseudomonas phage PseuGes_254]